MRNFFAAALMILFAAHICSAAQSALDRTTADFRARQSFELRSVEGAVYSVRIVGEDEKLLHDWFWAQDDEIFSGNYFAYVGTKNSATLNLQDAELFADAYSAENPQRINMTRTNRDGFNFVSGVDSLPDLLVSKIQITGGGYFNMKIFVVKDGRLQQLNFIGDDGKAQNSRDTIASPTTYRDDGKISVPWHTNAAPDAGTYETLYTLDIDNLILIPAHTNKR